MKASQVKCVLIVEMYKTLRYIYKQMYFKFFARHIERWKIMNKKDQRYKIAHREALIGVGLVIFNFLWWFIFAYGLGRKNPEQYTYILGLPDWFFYSCVLGFIVMAILVTVIVKRWFVDIPLNDEGEHEE